MTTTLRPAGPEKRGPDSARSREYDICVNGRVAGSVELAAHREYGSAVGRITRLAVDPADRRRGRATVALLAGEEVLRGWGCRRIDIGVPAAAGSAPLRLAAALGYAERRQTMLKELPGAGHREDGPPLPSGSVLRPMRAAEYPEWLAHDREQLMPVLIGNGCPPEEAEAAARRAHRHLLPDGPETDGMAMWVLAAEGQDGTEAVGTLLLRLDGAPRANAEGWVYAVRVAANRRGRGHGRTLMLAAERECGGAGARTLGLSVLAGNATAHGLYTSLGYRTAEVHLAKPLQ